MANSCFRIGVVSGAFVRDRVPNSSLKESITPTDLLRKELLLVINVFATDALVPVRLMFLLTFANHGYGIAKSARTYFNS